MLNFGMLVLLATACLLHIKPSKAACTDAASCNDHGTCATNICTCTDGYAGDNCETDPPCTQDSDCLNSGLCTKTSSPYFCTCTGGYGGATCADACTADDNCENGGSCNKTATPYACACATGYTGDTCDTRSGSVQVTFIIKSLLLTTFLSVLLK
ncbi:fibropellin-1-like isoform X3 [Haliotis rubra]|uniref:fibropellin-1-like isoform X3 n=1 Tax=Haliotis rubra TaxID=36100 RepID=UPI001EE523FF|nr:fibropellin-1-like isoform X3 [Haliotis rubra]